MQLVVAVQLRVGERQFHRIVDLFYLGVQSPNVGVGRVGGFFQHQAGHLGFRNDFEHIAGLEVHQDRVPGAGAAVYGVGGVCEWVGEAGDVFFPLLVDDEGPGGVDHFDEDGEFPGGGVGAGFDYFVGFAESDLDAGHQVVWVDEGGDCEAHEAAGGEYFGGFPVGAGFEVGAVGGGGCGEFF